ncbi:MAG: hypothetical protein R2726_22510 [Acidimicrobiales bacterium]
MVLLRSSRLVRILVGLSFLATSAVAILAEAPPASAEPECTTSPCTPSPVPVTATATPLTGLTDGQSVAIHVDADLGNAVYSVSTRLCKASAPIDFDADFAPTLTGKCIATPFPGSVGQASATVNTAPPNASADISFKVGIGTETFTLQDTSQATVTCGPADPCKIAVKVQVVGATKYFSFPFTYAGQASVPGKPAKPTAAAGDTQATVSWTAPADGGAPSTATRSRPTRGCGLRADLHRHTAHDVVRRDGAHQRHGVHVHGVRHQQHR